MRDGESAVSGGDASGAGLRTTTYTANALNQYSKIESPPSFDVLVRATHEIDVFADMIYTAGTRQGNSHQVEISASDEYESWIDLLVSAGAPVSFPSYTGSKWVPRRDVFPTYDDDGNVTNDGRWVYSWDAENRLVSMTVTQDAASAGAPKRMLEYKNGAVQ